MKNKKIEILAPAGSMESVIAAVQNGADAVYLGGKALNARRNATNFGEEELAEAVRYCHVRGAKVHLTLNTLMYDQEIAEAEEAIAALVRAGVDAVIVQDLGVVSLLQQMAPQIPLHASTQMAIHNLEGVRMAEALGFSRVVLARELTREEIAYLAQNTTLELEMFVHGALCMSISGQCYLSSMLGERSGNRGLCAQPCRLPFQVGQGNPYALSLKDLSLIEQIRELEALGVCSVKIEGRMKRPEYVAAAVDGVKSAYEGRMVDDTLLRSVFSRNGFTDGYYTGQRDRSMFGTRQKEDVMAASGVLKSLEQSYQKEHPRIPIQMDLTVREGEGIRLLCQDSDGNSTEVIGDLPQIAQTKPTDLEKAKQSLEKTGGTPYYLDKLTGQLQEGMMVPASQLNSVRRQALEELTALRQDHIMAPLGVYSTKELPKVKKTDNPALRVRLSHMLQLSSKMLEEAELVILPLGELHRYQKQGGAFSPKFCGELDSICFATAHQRQLLEKLKVWGLQDVYAATLWGVSLAKELEIPRIHGGFSMNLFNEEAVARMKDLGLQDTELSFELNLQKVNHLRSELPLGIVAYGYLPLMTLRNCPVEAAVGCDNCKGVNKIRDRKGIDFFIRCEQGVTKLYNSVPLYLAERMKEVSTSFATLFFTMETPEEAAEIFTAYQQQKPTTAPMTRGLYYRNVL